MEILVKYSNDFLKNKTKKDLRIFVVYKRKFIPISKTFRHYLLVIGYTGGGNQESWSFMFNGSNPVNSKIKRAFSTFPTYWEYEHHDNEIAEVSLELDEIDNKVFSEFQTVINKYLLYSEEEDSFIINLEKEEIINTTFFVTSKFPIKFLEKLNSIYWPFSTSWKL